MRLETEGIDVSEAGTDDPAARVAALVAARDWDGLQAEAERLAASHPQSWEPLYQGGRARLERGALAEAEQFLEAAMARHPAVPQLAVLYGIAGARQLAPEAALARWQALHARLPEAPGVRLGLAHGLRGLQRGPEAEALLADGLVLRPDHLPTLLLYAELARARGDWAVAASRFAAARRLAPQRRDIVLNGIDCLIMAGHLDAAAAELKPLADANPEDPPVMEAMAGLAAARGEPAEAIALRRRLVVAAPHLAATWRGLVGLLLAAGETDSAEATLGEGLRHHPEDPALLTEFARLATLRKDWVRGATRWRDVVRHAPPSEEAYTELAHALAESDQLDEAEIAVAEAVGFAPQSRAVRLLAARIAAARLDEPATLERFSALRRDFPEDEEIEAEAHAAKKSLKLEKLAVAKDESIGKLAPVRGSIRLQEKPQGPPRAAVSGPTALDRLKSGMAEPAPVQKAGFWGRLLGRE